MSTFSDKIKAHRACSSSPSERVYDLDNGYSLTVREGAETAFLFRSRDECTLVADRDALRRLFDKIEFVDKGEDAFCRAWLAAILTRDRPAMTDEMRKYIEAHKGGNIGDFLRGGEYRWTREELNEMWYEGRIKKNGKL